MSRQSQRSFDRLQATISDVDTGFEVCPVYYGTLVSRHKVQMSILEVRYDGKDINRGACMTSQGMLEHPLAWGPQNKAMSNKTTKNLS